nr:MAG TPA: hypothetical protein [Caudoviricetes sp.]
MRRIVSTKLSEPLSYKAESNPTVWRLRLLSYSPQHSQEAYGFAALTLRLSRL